MDVARLRRAVRRRRGAGRRRALEARIRDGRRLARARRRRCPDHVFVGCEAHRAGRRAGADEESPRAASATRVKVARADGLWVLDAYATARSLDEVACHFPDPWRGASKARRRLVNPLLFVAARNRAATGRQAVRGDGRRRVRRARGAACFATSRRPRGWARCDAFARFDSAYSLKASRATVARASISGFGFPVIDRRRVSVRVSIY